MIRINLLPSKPGSRGGAPAQSPRWLLAVLAVIVVEIIALFAFHKSELDDLKLQRDANAQLQGKIDNIKQIVANHEQVKKDLVVLRAREDAIAKLQSGRTGPTAVLLELSQVLTSGKGPTADQERLLKLKQENPLSVYNPSWDTRRLWITSYVESDRVVKLEGLARDASDVSELAQRLRLSVYFYDVSVLTGKKATGDKDKVELADFALQMKVRY